MKRLYMTLQGEGRCRCCSSCLWGEKEVGISLDPQTLGDRAKGVGLRLVPKLSATLLPAIFQPLIHQGTLSQDRWEGAGAESPQHRA